MLARARTFTLDGLQARAVTVELDIRQGLPAFTIIGLADAAVREARDRVRTAIVNSGYEFPARRITASLAPADLRKAGPGLDLALACAVLAASGHLPGDTLARHALFGELALDGEVRPSRGTLAIAEATRRAGLDGLLVDPAGAREALLVNGLRVAAVTNLQSAARVLRGGPADPPAPRREDRPHARRSHEDLADVCGQHEAVRALTVAAAGAHNCLLCGPPGTGKTMLAQRLPSILPPLTHEEAIEVARIQSAEGVPCVGALTSERPFRAPHHSISAAGLIGGARAGRLGEITMAHNGVLFLDELSQFAPSALDALRQPLEEGRVTLARSQRAVTHPARFMLVAATNPCPCGYAGERRRCRCNRAELARHRRRLSGPLLDRLDLLVGVERRPLDSPPATTSARARALVTDARERQARRLRGEGVLVNARMDAALLRRHVRMDQGAERLLAGTQRRGVLSARGQHRVLRVARTLADLAGHDRVGAPALAEALSLRTEAALDARGSAR